MNRLTTLLVSVLAIAFNAAAADDAVYTSDSVVAALMNGKPHVHLRYRYEHVDDDLVPANDAQASTLRAALGWETGVWEGISLYAEMEHISEVLLDDFKEGPGPVDPGHAGQYPVVADPPGTELNQAYVKYAADPRLTLKLGRQIITYRDAPFHRFLGTVLWRQNWQTHDGATLTFKPSDALLFNYGYSAQVNRIFGDDTPDPFDDFDCDCHFLNAKYTGLAHLKLEGYGYLLDIDNAPANSLDTYGLRAWGAYPLNETFKLLYAGEFAMQDDASGNPRSVDEDYYLAEAGINAKLPFKAVPALTVKVDYEVLEGNGTVAFQTPLATGHAFQGWADRFLTTPPDGIADLYVTAVAPAFGGKFVFSYHMLEADRLGYDYGDEINVQYTRKFARYFTFGTKAAIYDADRNPTALARAGALPNNDVTKVWAWVQFDY